MASLANRPLRKSQRALLGLVAAMHCYHLFINANIHAEFTSASISTLLATLWLRPT